nr:ATP-binding protein [uncultured Desulfobacter sp.]
MGNTASTAAWWQDQPITFKFSLGIGLLACLMVVVAATGYFSLGVLHRAHDDVGMNTNIQRLVFEMDRELEKARQLHAQFFLHYPRIGLRKAHEIYAQPSVRKTARAVSISRELKKVITETQASGVLQAGHIDLNLYLSSARRFAETSIESVELVTRLAAPENGLEADLAREFTLLRNLVDKNEGLVQHFHAVEHLVDKYTMVRKRHVMQSAFNKGFVLRREAGVATDFSPEEMAAMEAHLDRLEMLGNEILDVDAAIAGKFRDFELQREAVSKVSESLIRLAGQAVAFSEQEIKDAHRLAIILMVLAAFVGLAGALCIALVLNETITNRILRLTTVTQKFKKGSLDVTAEDDAKDELGRLGMTFNFMAARIKALIENLEAEVQAQTAELQQANDNLTQEIRERKQAEENLRQAQKMEAVGTLAGGIAHDFNNILSAIIGFAELADMDLPEGSKSGKSINEVLKAGFRGRDLVGRILSFSRKNAEGKVPVQIGPVAKEIIKLLRATIPSTINIREDIDSKNSVIMTNPTQVHQVIMNLATNAAQAMEKTGGILDVSLSVEDLENDLPGRLPSGMPVAAGRYLKLTVADTGPGILPGIMDRIFDPYFTTKETGKGTGMGLSVVHGIVTGCGGGIRVESRPGQGTSFHVYWPRVEEPETSVENEAQPVRGEIPEIAPVPGREHILVVDDEKSLVAIAHRRLTRLGYRVTATTQSREALALFTARAKEFDLVVTDQTMPDMTGIDLAERLRAVRQDIPIVLCTGNSEALSPENVKKVGICHVMMKPVQQEVFAETVRSVLDHWKQNGTFV